MNVQFAGKSDGLKTTNLRIGEGNYPLIIGESGMSLYNTNPIILDEVFVTSGVQSFTASGSLP